MKQPAPLSATHLMDPVCCRQFFGLIPSSLEYVFTCIHGDDDQDQATQPDVIGAAAVAGRSLSWQQTTPHAGDSLRPYLIKRLH